MRDTRLDTWDLIRYYLGGYRSGSRPHGHRRPDRDDILDKEHSDRSEYGFVAGRGALAWLRVCDFPSSDVSGRGLRRARSYAEEPDVFTETTVEQYADLANNLAYGVIALRTREERRRAESEIRQLNASLEKRVD